MFRRLHHCAIFMLVLACPGVAAGVPEDLLLITGLSGNPGGRMVYAARNEPKTLNTLIVSEAASKEVIQRLMADLIHINRATFRTEPALARSWTVSRDGLTYTLELRR